MLKMLSLFAVCVLLVCASAESGYSRTPFRVSHNVFNRIVGGQEAQPHQFPFQVSFQFSIMNSPSMHFCSGFIIDQSHIVSAAHCSYKLPNFKVVMKAGKHQLSIVESMEQVRSFSEIFLHEKYNGSIGPYDIAVHRLNKPLEFNEYVQPIKMAEAGSEFEGEVIASGWGSPSPDTFAMADKLKYAYLQLLDLYECKRYFLNMDADAPIAESNVCTANLNGDTACSGDSGGPLVKRQENGELVVVGITSWGANPCGSYNSPTVYTKVSAYRDWIAEKLKL